MTAALRERSRATEPNEVWRFYSASLVNSGYNATHARLNTQRKILAVLWSIWKRNVAYSPALFHNSTQTVAEVRNAAP